MEINPKDIRFAITSKNETDVTMVVTYWVEGYTLLVPQNLNIPVDPVTSAIPKGEALIEHIMAHAPIEQLRHDIIRFKTAVYVDFSEIDALIEAGASTIPKF